MIALKNVRGSDTYRLTGSWAMLQAIGWQLLEEGFMPRYIRYPNENAALFWSEPTFKRYSTWQDRAMRYSLRLATIRRPTTSNSRLFTLDQVAHGIRHGACVGFTTPETIKSQMPRKGRSVLRGLYVVIEAADGNLARTLQASGQPFSQVTLGNTWTAVYFQPYASQLNRLQCAPGVYIRKAFGQLHEQENNNQQQTAA